MSGIAEYKIPFTVKRITTGQDENGDPVETVTEWSSKCKFSRVSTKQLLLSGNEVNAEVAEMKYRTLPSLPEREIRNGDIVNIRGVDWNPFGVAVPNKEGSRTVFKQLLKNG